MRNTLEHHTLRRPIVWDNHGCMPLRMELAFLPQLERYRSAGVTLVSINVGYGKMDLAEHLSVLYSMREWVARHPEGYCLVSTVDDVVGCARDGTLGIVFDVEGMVPVEDNPSFVQTFYELGVRWMLIAYNRNNKAGGGCMNEDGGLTNVGRAIIDEMERVGMVLCLSHASERTVRDALNYVTNPPIFSHSNPSGDHPHPRNISNELMRACADRGGVIGLSGIGPFLGAETDLVERLLRQLRFVIDLVGPNHVGLGLDYVFDTAELDAHVRANPDLYPPGVCGALAMVRPEDVPAIAEGLARDNLSDDHVRAVMGGNWLRIAQSVWK